MSTQIEEIRKLSLIEQFRAQHHAIARMFAAGMTKSMIHQRTGISFRRLTLYEADPSFQELIMQKAQESETFADVDAWHDSAMSNMILAEAQIAEHLERAEEHGELLPVGILDRISQGRADRFGYSKHSNVTVRHDFAAELDRAIERSGKAGELKLIEGRVEHPFTPVPQEAPKASPPPLTPPSEPRSFATVLRRKVG